MRLNRDGLYSNERFQWTKNGGHKLKRFTPRLLVTLLVVSFSFRVFAQDRVKTGDEVFVEKDLSLIKGNRVGIITNQSGTLQDGRHIADILAKLPDVKVVALFGPEHGIRGNAADGKPISNSVDAQTGIHVYSLFGKTYKPTPEMLKGIDVLIYDIQDVGVRFYTFISTLDLTLEAAAENHIKYIVLDRPDMLRSDMVDGPVLVDSLRSFVGIQPVPSVYGMTPGEFATMINDAHMLSGGVKADLRVIKMENYKRSMWYDQTGLKWMKPSPNLPDMNAVEVYPGMVLIEATNVSEGRGTDHPFETIGAPFINAERLASLMNAQHLAGVKFEPTDFTPHPYPWATKPKYDGELCHGVKITVTDRNVFKPVEAGIYLVWAIKKVAPGKFKIRAASFDRRAGTSDVRLELAAGVSPKRIVSEWGKELRKFKRLRTKYLLYK